MRQVGCFGAIRTRNRAEQLVAAFECNTTSSVGEQAEVKDAYQSSGEDVKKKSTQELIC
jgi:hypothetical protein